jgi:hypothetical protein
MAVEVHIICQDGFGKDLWRVRAPWMQAGDLRRLFDFTQVDPLTWTARVSRAEFVSALNRLPAHDELAGSNVDPQWANGVEPAAREIEIYLAEW